MKKRIYRGFGDGLYNVGPFEKFIKGLKDSRWVLGTPTDSIGEVYMVFHMKPGVTIKYRNLDDGGGATYDTVIIYAYGEEENISKVEKIILEEAKKFNK